MRLLTAGVVLTALWTGSAGAADVNERYWNVQLGANALSDWDAQVDFGAGTSLPGRVALKRKWHGALAVGHQRGHRRYELEAQGGTFGIKRLSLGPVSQAVDADGRYQAVLANAYRADRLGDKVESFVGGGIGWGRVKLPRLALGTTCECFGPASGSGFAWQLRAGLGYRLSEQASLTLQVSRLNLREPERDATPSIRYDKARLTALTLGYARRF